jgi:hypothetical protein
MAVRLVAGVRSRPYSAGVTDNLAAVAVGRLRWLRWVVPVGLAIVGLLFLAYGVVNLSTQGWARASGTVGSCTPVINGGPGPGRNVHQDCDVTWSAGGTDHTTRLDLGTGAARTGQAIDLRVHGDQAETADPLWLGLASNAFGLVLVVTAGLMLLRRRRGAS